MDEIQHDQHVFLVCLFERAKGQLMADTHYQYREGVPVTEYYNNSGKALGKLHQLSKEYAPVHPRYDFFDKYNAKYINELIPDSLSM